MINNKRLISTGQDGNYLFDIPSLVPRMLSEVKGIEAIPVVISFECIVDFPNEGLLDILDHLDPLCSRGAIVVSNNRGWGERDFLRWST